MFSKSILITAVLCALLRIPKTRACDSCSLIEVDSSFDYCTTFSKNWFMWMTTASFSIDTFAGVTYCTSSNYASDVCASVTVTFDLYDDTGAISFQSYGVIRDTATLQMAYYTQYSDGYFANSFEFEGVILFNGEVAYIQVNDGELTSTETGYTILAVDCVDDPNVLIIWFDCGAVSVFITDTLYDGGCYDSYYDAVITVLTDYGIDTSLLYTVEFPY